MVDLRGDDPHLHEVTKDRKGTRFLQTGPIDDQILCQSHEQQTQTADRYGIEFCRRVIAEVPQDGATAQISNPDPDMLVRFACLMIWRYCISKYGRGIGSLGPYRNQLQAAVFNDARDLPVMLLARNHLRLDGKIESQLAIAPFPVRLAKVRCWLFSVSGVQFFLKLDKRSLPGESEGFAANGANPVTLLQADPMLTQNVPILRDLMTNMTARRKQVTTNY